MSHTSNADLLLAIVYSTVLEYIQHHELLACITYLETLLSKLSSDPIDQAAKEIVCADEVAMMMKRLKHDVRRHLSSKKNKQQSRERDRDIFAANNYHRTQSTHSSELSLSEHSEDNSVGISQISSLTSNHNFEILHRPPGLLPARSPMARSPRGTAPLSSPQRNATQASSDVQLPSCGPKLQNILQYCLLEIRYLFITRQLNKADNMLRLKKYDKALKVYNLIPINKLLRDSSDAAQEDAKLPFLTALYQYHHNKGITLLKLHQVAQSIESFKKAIEIAQGISQQQAKADEQPKSPASKSPYVGCENSAENLAIALIHAERFQEAMHILVTLQKQLRLRLKQVPVSEADFGSSSNSSDFTTDSTGGSAGNCCELLLSGNGCNNAENGSLKLCHICTTISPQLLHCNIASESSHGSEHAQPASSSIHEASSRRGEIRADVVRSLCLAFCYAKLGRLIEAEHILAKFATVHPETVGADRFQVIFRAEYEHLFIANAQLHNGWKMLYRMVDKERKAMMSAVSEGSEGETVSEAEPVVNHPAETNRGKQHQSHHSMSLSFSKSDQMQPGKRPNVLITDEELDGMQHAQSTAATTKLTCLTTDTDPDPVSAKQQQQHRTEARNAKNSDDCGDRCCLSTPDKHRRGHNNDQHVSAPSPSNARSNVAVTAPIVAVDSQSVAVASGKEQPVETIVPPALGASSTRSTAVHPSRLELNMPLVSSTPSSTTRAMRSDESVSTLSSSNSRQTQQSSTLHHKQHRYKPLSPPMSLTDSHKLFSSNIVSRCHSMALDKPNLRSPGGGSKFDSTATNTPQTPATKDSSIEMDRSTPKAVIQDLCSVEDLISFSPPPVSIDKPLRKNHRGVASITRSTHSTYISVEHSTLLTTAYPPFSPAQPTSAPRFPFYFNDILSPSIETKHKQDVVVVDLLDLSPRDSSRDKLCYSPPPPRPFTPPLTKHSDFQDFVSFSPVVEVSMVSSPVADASHIIAGTDIVDSLERSPPPAVQTTEYIRSSWSSPERTAALVSSPDHLQSFVSPLTESSELGTAEVLASPALYQDDIAPASHFRKEITASPSTSFPAKQPSTPSAAWVNSLVPRSPAFSLDRSTISMSSTPAKALRPVMTPNKQDALELFMKFQPAGCPQPGSEVAQQHFAQGWYPGAQTWVTFPYKDLLYPGPYPKDVDVRKRECYLSQEEFAAIFKVSREAFYQLPSWKQISLRKTCKLF